MVDSLQRQMSGVQALCIVLTWLQGRIKVEAFQLEAALGMAHRLLPQLQRPLQAVTATTISSNPQRAVSALLQKMHSV